MRILKNKKFYLAGSAIILAGLFFVISASPASARGCEKNQNNFSFSKFLNPLASLAEKIFKDFGYKITLAASPDPDFCGSDSVGCSGATPTAAVSWETGPLPILGDQFCYYILSIPGVGNFNTGETASYAISSGLTKNTTYSWSVEAYYANYSKLYCDYPSYVYSTASMGYTYQPYGSFTTSSCAACGNGVCETGETYSSCPADCPGADIGAGATTIPYNTSTTISWSASGVDSCVVSPTGWTGTSGSESTGNLTSSQTYTINCTGPNGPFSASVTVNVSSDFTLNSSNNIYVTLSKGQGKYSSATTLTITSFFGFSSTVNLSVQSVSPSLPSCISPSFTPNSLTSSQYLTGSQFKVYVGADCLTSSQQYTITVQGIDGGIVRTVNVILNAQIASPSWKEI